MATAVLAIALMKETDDKSRDSNTFGSQMYIKYYELMSKVSESLSSVECSVVL